MRPVLALTAALVLTAACAAPSAGEEEEGASATDGAELTKFEDAPLEKPEVGMVFIRPGSKCTGTLVGKRTVITAAHCFAFEDTRIDRAERSLGWFGIDTAAGRKYFDYHAFASGSRSLTGQFDIAIIELDAEVPADIAKPATLAREWPDERLTVFGYGSFGKGCKGEDAGPDKKRKTTIPTSFPWVKSVSCPGDSGGPMFRGTSSEVVAVVKGHFGVQLMGDVVEHRDWVLARLFEAERGELAID